MEYFLAIPSCNSHVMNSRSAYKFCNPYAPAAVLSRYWSFNVCQQNDTLKVASVRFCHPFYRARFGMWEVDYLFFCLIFCRLSLRLCDAASGFLSFISLGFSSRPLVLSRYLSTNLVDEWWTFIPHILVGPDFEDRLSWLYRYFSQSLDADAVVVSEIGHDGTYKFILYYLTTDWRSVNRTCCCCCCRRRRRRRRRPPPPPPQSFSSNFLSPCCRIPFLFPKFVPNFRNGWVVTCWNVGTTPNPRVDGPRCVCSASASKPDLHGGLTSSPTSCLLGHAGSLIRRNASWTRWWHQRSS